MRYTMTKFIAFAALAAITGPSSEGKPKQIGLVPSMGRAAPGGRTRG